MQRKLLQIAAPKDATPPNFAEETFAYSHKTVKFVKVFYFKSFPLYGIDRKEHSERNWKTLFNTKQMCNTYKALTYNGRPR